MDWLSFKAAAQQLSIGGCLHECLCLNNEAFPCSACSSVPLSLGLSPRIFKHVK